MPDFPVWPQCNIGCVFCSNPVEGFRHTTENYSYDALRRKLLDYKRGLKTFVKFDEVSDYFNLTGGEPTLHPEFIKVLALIRTEFPNNLIRLLTNGRTFFDDNLARRTCGIAGLPFEIAIPLFGYDDKTHESISRTPGSFVQTTQGLKHLEIHRRKGQIVEVRIILTKIQMRYFDGLLDYLLKDFAWVDRIVLLFEEIEGFAELYKDRLTFTQSECAAQIDRNFNKLQKFKEVRLYHFSLCTLPTRLWPYTWRTLADFKITWLDGCRKNCLYRGQCVGVHRSYLKHVGAPDISPITVPRDVSHSENLYHPISSAHE